MFWGVITFILIVIGQSLKAFMQYSMLRFTSYRELSISSRLLSAHLRQPYEWFLTRHSSELVTRTLFDVEKVVSGILLPALSIIANLSVCVFMIILLLWVHPAAAATSVFIIGGLYATLFIVIRNYLQRIGRIRLEANKLRHKAAQDAFGSIRDIKLMGLEQPYVRRFRGPSNLYAHYAAVASILSQVPRFALEVIVFGGIMIFVLILIGEGDGRVQTVLPVIGLYAFAGVWLFPALQQIYGGATSIRFNQPALDGIHESYSSSVFKPPNNKAVNKQEHLSELKFQKQIKLVDVDYSYPESSGQALASVSVIIEAGSTVGVAGRSGCGKTTLVDVIVGLLAPISGQMLVDGKTITGGELNLWQRQIGYVPQTVFLEDDTIARNIALSRGDNEIDGAAVVRAAKIADLHHFITTELPLGYQTPIGERGARLSGGQCQRIGIARALYADPQILVLDEATSALDNLTERSVMEGIASMPGAKTIIIVAHRVSTLKECDKVIFMNNGRCEAIGSYDELEADYAPFRELAQMLTNAKRPKLYHYN